MPIFSQYNSYFGTSMPIISQSEKLLYVLKHPAGLFSWTISISVFVGHPPSLKKVREGVGYRENVIIRSPPNARGPLMTLKNELKGFLRIFIFIWIFKVMY